MTFILGLTGSFGSGKSTIATFIHELTGAPIIDADVIAREALAPGSPLLHEVVREFGPDVFEPAGDVHGTLNRKALAERAFGSVQGAGRLNAIVHPYVRERELAALSRHAAEPLIVLDVPLLFEAGMNAHCDKVAAVTISERERFRRLRERGFDEQSVMRRLAHQFPQSRKAALADFVIDNSGTPAETRTQVQQLLSQIQKVEKTPS